MPLRPLFGDTPPLSLLTTCSTRELSEDKQKHHIAVGAIGAQKKERKKKIYAVMTSLTR